MSEINKIDPKHTAGKASTKNRKSKTTSGPSKGRGGEVGGCGHRKSY